MDDHTRTQADDASHPAAPRDAPQRVGRYRILRQIGQGGMGTVYEAEQDSPRRTVALKLIRPGAESVNVLRRSRHEAEVLARLQHPGIAQIYDAGMVELHGHSQPFFAMELVRGRRLDEYAKRLDVRRRLELLASICDAVQHAHQQGVIHRDLKPGNILVTDDGHPKILDFGIARLTDADVQLTTIHTELGALLGTVVYMSPEQASGNPDQIDTRSDVYTLGVLGYQMLADRLPYDVAGKLIPQAVSVIREHDPGRLSTVNRMFRGDIETIFAKALEKEKGRRYSSAAELAADIRRYLNDEPILARPPSTLYQLRKLARRHRPLVAGVGAGLVALIVGLIGTAYGLVRANRALAVAENEARKSQAINDFLLQDMLAAPDPWADGRDVRVADVLDRAAEQVGEAFEQQPEVEAAVRLTLGRTYEQLGLYDEADVHLSRALRLRRELLGESHRDTVTALHQMGSVQMQRDDFDEAFATMSEVVQARRRLLGPEHPDTLLSMVALGQALHRQGRFEEALDVSNQVLEIRRRLLGHAHPDSLKELSSRGWMLERAGKLEAAQEDFQRALEGFTRLYGPNHPDTIAALNGLATVYFDRAQTEPAERAYRQALEASRRVFGDRHPDTAVALVGLANVLDALGREDEAEPLLREALALYRERLGDDHQYTMIAVNNLATLLAREGRLEESQRLHQSNLENRQRVLGDEHPDVAESLEGLGILYRLKGDHQRAAAYQRRSIEVQRAVFGEVHPSVANAMSNLAFTLREAGDYAGAESVLRELLPIERQLLGEAHPYVQNDTRSLVLVLLRLGRAQDAETLARKLLELRLENPPRQPDRTPLTRGLIGECLMEQGRFEEAEPLLLESHRELAGGPDVPDESLGRARDRLAELYRRWGRPDRAADFD